MVKKYQWMCLHQDDYYFNDEILEKQNLNWDETGSIDWDKMDRKSSMTDGVVLVEGTMVLLSLWALDLENIRAQVYGK